MSDASATADLVEMTRQQRRGWVLLGIEDAISRATAYLDINRARTAAERLVESKG
jgi:hypothetical protein